MGSVIALILPYLSLLRHYRYHRAWYAQLLRAKLHRDGRPAAAPQLSGSLGFGSTAGRLPSRNPGAGRFGALPCCGIENCLPS
jgi:hypothetical protein